MKILYIHQYFKTPNQPGGTRSYWIAKKLIEEGHEVTMLSSITEKELRLLDSESQLAGLEVVYFKVPYNQKMSVLRRAIAFFDFSLKSILYVLKSKKYDLVIATSTPLTVGLPALIAKWFKKTPFIFEVRDLWPEVPIQMGALKQKWMQKLAISLEKTIYKNSEHIIALSSGMRDGVLKFVSSDKVSVIPNMSKIEEFYPREKNFELMEKLGLKKDSFKVIHFGALGLANGAESILKSAELVKDSDDIEFVFIGGGSTEDSLKNICEEKGLLNVRFLGRFPMRETSEIVNFCDVSIVSFKDLPILQTNSPNKLFDSLSAGKPVIVNSAGWTKELVENSQCGFYVDPSKPEELIDKIFILKSSKDLCTDMGKKARWLAENKFDKSILCDEFAKLISNLELGKSKIC